jgi:phage terminase large subunit-like protein
MQAATAQEQDAAWEGHNYVIGVDWGRTNDATVFAVVDTVERALVYLDRMIDTDYDSQRLRLRALSDRFGNPPIIAEANSIGLPNIERLQNMGLAVQGFNTTNASKAEAIQALELAFESGDIRILEDDILTAELMAYEAERLPSGLVRYGAPSGAHDDCVMALALAWFGARDAGSILAW